jgi:hypothetical protein
MSLWGKYDAKPQTNTAAATVVVTAANSTVKGVNTKFSVDFAAGDYLTVGGNHYIFTEVSNLTTASVRSANSGASLVGAQSNADYVVSEKPKFVTYSECEKNGGDAKQIFGVSTAELSGSSALSTVTVTASGNGYSVLPQISFSDSGGSGSGATASARATVVTITPGTKKGSGYTNSSVIRVTSGTGSVANATVTTNGTGNVAILTLVNGGSYSVIPTITNANTTVISGGGNGNLTVNLSLGLGSVTVTANGSGYVTPVVTVANTGGTRTTLATASAVKTGTDGGGIAHAGWVRRTVGSGGRAGRVHYEVLVAGSSITNDAADDAQLPE